MSKKTIGILTGGGDCPGLNPAIKAATKKALESGFKKVLGIREGWLGLVDDNLLPIDLTLEVVRHIDRQGGTILGTSRTDPYKTHGGSKAIIDGFSRLNLDALITLGGNGTLSAASDLFGDLSLPIVGIPKTIDLDISNTDYTLGFASAVQIITDSIDALRSTAESHSRIFIVEVMGRDAGHLALQGGISSSASIILLPEYRFDFEKVCDLLQARKNRGVKYSIVIIGEGAKPQKKDTFGDRRLGSIGQILSEAIEQKTGLESRAVVLSHLQRGGKPVAFDRRMGFYYGIAAVEAIINKDFGHMTSLKDGHIVLSLLKDAVKDLKVVDVDKVYDMDIYRAKQSVLNMLGPIEEMY